MRRHKLLPAVIGVFAALFIIAAFCVILERLTIDATPSGSKVGEHEYTYSLGMPDLGLLPVLWRSGDVKKLLRAVMIGLSFLGGVRIGTLLLSNREKLRAIRDNRVRRIREQASRPR